MHKVAASAGARRAIGAIRCEQQGEDAEMWGRCIRDRFM